MSEPFTTERRADDNAMLGLVTQINSKIDELGAKFTNHVENDVEERKQLLKEILDAAFPDGDADGHRRRHEAELVKLEARAAFWKKMAEQLAEKGLLIFGGWLLYVVGTALWAAFIAGPPK